MTARIKNSYRPTLETLEDRCLPSTSPWAMWTQALQNAKIAEATIARIGALTQINEHNSTMGNAALMSNGYQDANAARFIRIEIPSSVWYKTGLFVDSNTNLGRVLNSIPTKSPNGDFYVSRMAGMRAENGYHVKFEYQVNYGKWQTADGWTTSKTSDPNVEKINVPDGWKPHGTTGMAYYSFNIRVTLIDPRGHAVETNGPAIAWTVHDKSPHANNAGVLADNGQTQTAGVMAHNQAESATEMSLSDRFFVALAHKNHPDGLPIITAGNWGV